MSSALHWVTYDPTTKGPRQVESSVRLHLSARAKSKRFHKTEAKKDSILRSKARDIVGWHRRPAETPTQDQDESQADCSDTSTSGSETSSPPHVNTMDVQFDGSKPVNFSRPVPPDSTGQLIQTSIGRSLDLKPENSVGDFALPLIQYVTAVWLPSALSIPLNCQIGGHSPIYTGDNELAQTVLRRAFQSKQKFFPLALSAFVSARMRFASSIPLNRGHEPEYFAGQAIRALREEIAIDKNSGSDARVDSLESTALGLAFLMLTASFAQSDHKAITLYGRMLNHAICELGGVGRLSEFSSYFVIVTDFLTASANLCSTSIDSSVVLSTGDGSVQICEMPLELRIGQIHSRLRASILFHQMMQSVLNVVLSVDEKLVSTTRSYVQKHSSAFYRTATCVLRPENQEVALLSRSYGQSQTQLIQADNIASRARYLAVSLWLRLLTLKVLSEDCQTPTDCDLLQPETMARDGCQILECLAAAQEKLKDTGWGIPPWLTIWIIGLLSCLLPLQRDHAIGPPLLDAMAIHQFIQHPDFAPYKALMNRETIEHILTAALPLDAFDGYDVDTVLEIAANGRFCQSEYWLS